MKIKKTKKSLKKNSKSLDPFAALLMCALLISSKSITLFYQNCP